MTKSLQFTIMPAELCCVIEQDIFFSFGMYMLNDSVHAPDLNEKLLTGMSSIK